MNPRRVITAVLALALVVVSSGYAQQTAEELYQAGLYQEEVQGNLESAIDIYRQILEGFPNNRAVGAKAQLHVGLCYEKLGLREAQQAYQGVINDYPEAAQEVAVARQRLASLTRALAELEREPRFRKVRIASKPDNGILSPDGSKLAFTSTGSLWIMPLQGQVAPDIAGEPVRVTEPMGARNDGNVSAWSADGRWIAFNAEEGGRGEIYVVSSAGGEPRKVPVHREPGSAFSHYRLGLSPDGAAVAYSSSEPGAPELQPGSPATEIYASPVDGGQPTRLTRDSRSWRREPAFSPDGKWIAYVDAQPSDTGQVGEVWVVPRDGGAPVHVIDVPGGIPRGPVWSPDGRYIAFGVKPGPGGGSEAVWLVPFLANGEREPPVKIDLPLPSYPLPAGWTTGSELGAFLEAPQRAALYTVPAAGGEAVQITPEMEYAWHPRFAPDGKTVFFDASTQGPDGKWKVSIRRVPAEGGEVTLVPIDADPPVIPAMPGGGYMLSPDGSRIVFFGYREERPIKGNIWTIPAEGGEPTQITEAPIQDRYPCWSPDGNSVAFLRLRRDSEQEYVPNIYTVPAEGGEPRQLSSDGDRVEWATIRYSPNGQWIAYFSKDKTIDLLPVEGGEPRVLTEVQVVHSHSELAWSPDGERIAYTGRGSIWVVPFAGGEPTEIETGVLTEDTQELHIDWSPDGEKIVFSAAHGGDYELWLISDFLPTGEGQ